MLTLYLLNSAAASMEKRWIPVLIKMQSRCNIQYCLKLPQSSYDQYTGKVVTLTSPASRRKLFKLKGGMTLIFKQEVGQSDSVLDRNADNDSTQSTPSPPTKPTTPSSAVSPNMSRLIGSSTSGVVLNYFGSLDLLDCPQEFDSTFGVNPMILSASPTSNATSDVLQRVRSYADKCMLEYFLEICRKDYVVGFDVGSKIVN